MWQIKNKIIPGMLSAVLFIQSCGSTSADSLPRYDYVKLENYIVKYDATKDIELYRKGMNYEIADSLSSLLRKIDPNSVINDSSFLKLTGELLEKKYLAVRQLSDSPKAFFVYNVSIWAIQRECTQYILNVHRKVELPEGKSFDDYVVKVTDFYCIDALVNNIENFNWSSETHQQCVELIQNKETGGCDW